MRLTTLALAPLFVPQAIWVAARASRLPEAAGPRSGQTGTGPALRLLIVGDSSAAGVGVSDQGDALAGQLVKRLARQHTVTWQLHAKSGATTASTLRDLNQMPPQTCDAALIALGVNDTKNGVGEAAWRDRYTALLDMMQTTFGARVVCVSGVPPLRDFPLLPWPLNAVLGGRATRFDQTLQSLAKARDGVVHLPMVFALDPSAMASDGFHPGPEVYAQWADRAATAIQRGAGAR